MQHRTAITAIRSVLDQDVHWYTGTIPGARELENVFDNLADWDAEAFIHAVLVEDLAELLS
jgi:hypothetical protein